MDSSRSRNWPVIVAVIMGVPGWVVVGLMLWFRYYPDPLKEPDVMTRAGALMTGWLPIVVVFATMTLYMFGLLVVVFRTRKNTQLTRQVSELNADLASEKQTSAQLPGLREEITALTETNKILARDLSTATSTIGEARQRATNASRDAEEAEKKASKSENESQAHYKLFEDRERQLGDLLWLKKRMLEQAKDISEHIIVRQAKLRNLKLENDRCAIVALTIRNESVFDITIRSENVTGRLFYNTKARRDPARVLESDGRPPIRNLEPLQQRILILEQPLLQSEAETIKDTRKDANAQFWLGNLSIPISVENIPQHVESKPLRIGEHVEYLYLKDYNNHPLEELEAQHGKNLTVEELRRLIDRLPPAERAGATKAALELYGASFYE